MIDRSILDSPTNVRFDDLVTLCSSYFGEPRIAGSHHIFKMPWPGDPRINLQRDGAKAKLYQVRQVQRAIDRMGAENAKARHQ
ncbi:MAG: toxin HicA [Spirochaetae bacterium HGW-Spirochaetae-3]|nr:MAG: toxin HicA [Spirochaetae bacterium HGW-Spirochaetae-3]